MKVYIALTPLVLQNAAGDDFRVEKGQAVELTDEQYQDVAAHVMPTEIAADDLEAAGVQPDGETSLEEAVPAAEQPADDSQSEEQSEQAPEKPRRNAKTKEQ